MQLLKDAATARRLVGEQLRRAKKALMPPKEIPIDPIGSSSTPIRRDINDPGPEEPILRAANREAAQESDTQPDPNSQPVYAINNPGPENPIRHAANEEARRNGIKPSTNAPHPITRWDEGRAKIEATRTSPG